MNKYGDRTHCKNDHEFTPENTRIRSDGSRVCRECRRIQSREQKRRVRSAETLAQQRISRQRGRLYWHLRSESDIEKVSALRAKLALINAEAEQVGKLDDKASSPWNVLRPGEQEQVALDRLNRIIERVDTNCADDPGPYQDYTVAPSPEVAKAMCSGCPALAACGIYGTTASIEWASKGRVLTGVWGGKVYGPKVLEEL